MLTLLQYHTHLWTHDTNPKGRESRKTTPKIQNKLQVQIPAPLI